jgi:hypothetical protein
VIPYLSIEIVYSDEHLIETIFKASNGRYAGTTFDYSSADAQEITDLGNLLKGFPKNASHIEETTFGANTHLKFYCLDQLGHAAVHIQIKEDDWATRPEAIGKASFEICFEPAQMDQFSDVLLRLGREKSGKATLNGVSDGREIIV